MRRQSRDEAGFTEIVVAIEPRSDVRTNAQIAHRRAKHGRSRTRSRQSGFWLEASSAAVVPPDTPKQLKRHDERIRCYAIANGSMRAQPAKDARVNDHTQHHDDDVQV